MSVEIIWYIYIYIIYNIISYSYSILVGGWPTPLKNHGVRQLGWWNSQYFWGKNVPNHQPVWYMISNYNSYMINIWVLYHILHNIISYSYSITYTHLSDATNARPQHPQHPHPQPLTPALRIQAFALASTSAGKKTTARYSTMVTPRPIHGSTLDILRRGWGWGWMGKAWKSRKKK